jgi:hypothetical protein
VGDIGGSAGAQRGTSEFHEYLLVAEAEAELAQESEPTTRCRVWPDSIRALTHRPGAPGRRSATSGGLGQCCLRAPVSPAM